MLPNGTLQDSIATVIVITEPGFTAWLDDHQGTIAHNQWFQSPNAVGRSLGLGWAQAMQTRLDGYEKGWKLLVDCGGHAGDAATVISLGLPGVLFTGEHLDKTSLPAIAQRLSSMAEQRGAVFTTSPPPLLPTA